MKFDIIEIGTSNFKTAVLTDKQSIILAVEPLKFYLDELPDNPRTIKVNAAISDLSGVATIYYITPTDIKRLKLPWWLRGCNSINNIHPTAKKILQKINKIDIMQHQEVCVMTLNELFRIYDVTGIEFLKIDTEGHDHIIINQYISIIGVKPYLISPIIQFETNSLTSKTVTGNIITALENVGYSILDKDSDNTTMKFQK